MTTQQQLQKAIETASNIGWNSTLSDLEQAEDAAFMLPALAETIKNELLDEIYAAMEFKKHG